MAIARALIHEPRLLLLDEPTSSLDVRARSELRPLIRATLDGFRGVRVLVTHDPVEALTLADRIVVLEDGNVTQSGTARCGSATRRAPLRRRPGRREPVRGPARAARPGHGIVVTIEGSVVVPWPDGLPLEPLDGVLAVLRPSDVVLHTSEPEGSRADVLQGRVAEIAIEGERARVRLAGAPPVVAEVTLGSVDRLGSP